MMYLFLVLSLSVFAQTEALRRMEPVKNPQKLEDFDHINKGCPENSECDKVMGSMLARWKETLEKLPEDRIKASAIIEDFHKKSGLPVEFYTNQKSQLGFRPVIYSSPCSEHNPKTGDKILRGISLVRSMQKDKVVIWKDPALLEVPTSESLIVPQTIQIMDGANQATFYAPINDQPLFIKDKSLVILREDEGVFYALKISADGVWKVIPLDLTTLSSYEEKRENVTCPAPAGDKKISRPKEFNLEFCKTVWDDDQKKVVTVKMLQGCSI